MSMWQQWEGRLVNGRFPLQQYLGGSTHSAVYLTEIDGSRAAIKLIQSDAEGSQVQVSRWKSASRLSHPHLLRILETGRWHTGEREMPFAVIEFADENLAEILPGRSLTAAEARAMLLPTLDALDYLHKRGMVHGTIKPANIMAVGDKLKLSSDGIRAVDESTVSAERESTYDAPEKARGQILPSGDIWSLGATLVEALTNHLPDKKDGSDPKLPENIPEPFGDIARHCLNEDPERRWSIAEIRQRLEQSPAAANEVERRKVSNAAGVQEIPAQAASRKVSGAHQRETTAEGLGTTGRPGIVRVVAVSIIALAVIVAGVFLFQHRSKTPQPAAITSSQQSVAPSTQPTEKPHLPPSKPNSGGIDHGAVSHKVLPDIPMKARSTITGKVNVKVKVAVDASGAVSHAALTSHGPSAYFADQALQAARKWTFQPPTIDGKAMPSEWSLSFEFKKNGTTAAPHRISPGG